MTKSRSIASAAPEDALPLRVLTTLLLGGLISTGLILISRYSYPLFHSLGELFSIVIAWSFFTLAWNTRSYVDNDFFILVGIASLFTSSIDLLHTLSYKGINLFPGFDANLPTQLSIAGRYLYSAAILVAVCRVLWPSKRHRPLNAHYTLIAMAVVTTLLIGAIFTGAFPTCHVEGAGLTPFKKTSGLIISSLLLTSIWLLWQARSRFDRKVLKMLLASTAMMIPEEIALISYVDIFGFSSLLGHLFKMAAYYLLYRATVVTGLKRPYGLLFRELKQTEARLRTSLAEKEVLLKEVHHRVKNNLAAIMGLLDLEGQELSDELTKTALSELSARIRSMALVHEHLYRSEDFSRIDFQDYLEALIANLCSSYERSENIHVSVVATDVVLGLDNAVPCGLLITELVTNAFKYAFPEGRPRPGAQRCEITVSVRRDGEMTLLSVADNGVGLPAGMDWKKTKTLGLVLVRMLGEHQLRGRIELNGDHGTTFRLHFPSQDREMMRDE